MVRLTRKPPAQDDVAIGSTAGPVLCFVLALQLTKHHHWLTRPLRIALWAFGVLTCAVVFTNELHHHRQGPPLLGLRCPALLA
jgi:hypothetical protein